MLVKRLVEVEEIGAMLQSDIRLYSEVTHEQHRCDELLVGFWQINMSVLEELQVQPGISVDIYERILTADLKVLHIWLGVISERIRDFGCGLHVRLRELRKRSLLLGEISPGCVVRIAEYVPYLLSVIRWADLHARLIVVRIDERRDPVLLEPLDVCLLDLVEVLVNEHL